MGLFPGVGQDAQLKNAWLDFKDWCRLAGHGTQQEPFSSKTLHWDSGASYPDLGGKGFDNKLVLLWLGEFIPKLHDTNQDDPELANYLKLMGTAAWGIAAFLTIIDKAGLLMLDCERTEARFAGRRFFGASRN